MWVFMYNGVTRCGPAQLFFIYTDQFNAQWDMNTAAIPAGGRELVNTTVLQCVWQGQCKSAKCWAVTQCGKLGLSHV